MDPTALAPPQTGTAFIAGMLIYFFQKWLKSHDWYCKFVETFPAANKWVHRGVAAIGAGVATLGIMYSFSGDWNQGWHIGIDIPNGQALLQAGWTWIAAFTTQQSLYETKKTT